jgi:lipid II:glycine glycyltransferase (peptidoglycan interpeptide bridge formation enzyme)
MKFLKQEPPLWLENMQKAYEDLGIDTKDPYSLLKLQLKRVNELINENNELLKKYPKQNRGLKITLTRLKQMKKMLEEQMGDN